MSVVTFLEKLLLDKDEDTELYQYYYGNGKLLKNGGGTKNIGKGKGLFVGGFYDIFYGDDNGGGGDDNSGDNSEDNSEDNSDVISNISDIDIEDDGIGGRKMAVAESPSYTNVNACAPSKIGTYKTSGTCFSEKALRKIAHAINETPDMKKISGVDKKSKKELWKDIKNQMKGCNNEWCWLSKKFVKKVLKAKSDSDEIFLHTFKIPMPKGKYQWLTTDDIEFTIKQFIPLADKAAFLGAVPVDFATFSQTKDKFTNEFIKKLLKKGIRNIAIVFNTDPHNKSGRHWISAIIRIDKDGKKGKAYYYDSFGERAPKPIEKWFKDFPIPLKYEYNKIQHQYENSECGVYSIHFVVRMLFGASYHSVTNNIINDVEMNAKRKKYFNPYK